MKTLLPAMCCFLFSAIAARAQTNRLEDLRSLSEPQSVEIGSTLVEPPELLNPAAYVFPSTSAHADNRSNLPDMPRPKGESATDRPRQNGRGRYSRVWVPPPGYDPLHLDKPDPSWARAIGHPVILIPSALLVGLTALQLIKTDRCIDANKSVCNLIFKKNRAAAYAVNIPLTTGVVWLSGRMKEKGNGQGSVLLTGFSLIYEGILAHTANPKVLTCQAGRIPQCQ